MMLKIQTINHRFTQLEAYPVLINLKFYRTNDS